MKKDPKHKALNFLSLAEILRQATYTGEYKDPAFRKEIDEIIDDIFSDELQQIRTVSEYERELLKRDAEIAKLKALLEIERNFAKRMEKMDKEVREVFRNLTQQQASEEVDRQVQEALQKMKEFAEEIKETCKREFEEQRNSHNNQLETRLGNIIGPPGPRP